MQRVIPFDLPQTRAGLNANKPPPQLQQTFALFLRSLIILFGFIYRAWVFYFSMFSDCVKGYYKRAKAHAAVWNEKEARRDFNMVASLDVTLASLVGRELRALSERMKEKYWEEKEVYWNMLEKTQDKEEEDQGSGGDGTKEQGGEENQEISEGGELSPGAAGDHEEACSATIGPSASSGSEGKDWQQMLRLIMLLQDEGNFLIKEKRFQEASAKFTQALEYVDALRKLVSVPLHRSSKSAAIWRVALVLLSAGKIPNCSPAKLEECQQLLTRSCSSAMIEIKIAAHAPQSSPIVVSPPKSSCGIEGMLARRKAETRGSKNTSYPQISLLYSIVIYSVII